MNKPLTLRNLIVLLAFWAATVSIASAQSFTENFDDITTLPGSGWVQVNNSTPVGTTGWFQGNSVVFPAFNGATTAYIGANYNNTTGAGDISNWLIMPNVTLYNGDVITFRTRTVTSPAFPDRLELRMSTNGASTNVGADASTVGDFSTLLLSVNPTLTTLGYPSAWTLYTVTVSGLSGPTSGRYAFRYYVTNGGPSGANSDYMGIDNIIYTANPCPAITLSPATLPAGTGGVAYSQTVTQTGGNGIAAFSVTSGSLPNGLSLSSGGAITGTPLFAGIYFFTITATDTNGCPGQNDYSITVNCPPLSVNITGTTALCSGATGSLTASANEPNPSFNWSNGDDLTTITINTPGTYTVTASDAYGCTATASSAVNALGDFTVSGSLQAGDGIITGPRMTRNGIATDCTPGNACPGNTGTNGYFFDKYNVVNNGAADICATITLTTGCGFNVFASTYLGSFNPANICANYLGNLGSSPVTSGSFTASIPANSTVVVVVSGVNSGVGCGSYTLQVTGLTQPVTITPSGPTTFCSYESVDLTAGGASSYVWSTGVSTATITVNTANTYTVSGTDFNGCTASASQNINVNQAPVVDLGGPYVQCGGTVTLDATDVYLSYAWSDGITTTETFVAGVTGNYSVTVSDEAGCTGSGSASVTINIPPVVNLGGPYVACIGPVVLDAGNPGSSYEWSDGVTTTQTLSAGTTGNYSVTVTDINTCTGSAMASVTINLPPLNETGYTICQGLTVPAGEGLTASGCGDVSSSFAGTTSLSDPTFNRSVTGINYNASGIGTAVHYLTHTFTVGTTGSYTFSMCGFDTYLHIYQGSFNPAFPATNFLVADDDGNTGVCSGGSNATITLTAGVTYVYVATGFGNNSVGPYSVTFTGPGPVYEGPLSEPLWFSSAVGGPLVATGSPFNPVGTATLPNTNTPGTYTFYTACPNFPNCRMAVDFVINPSPVVNLGGPYNQCGGNVPLDAGAGNTSYSWSDGTSAQTTVATTSGTYTVTVANSFNCSATGTTEVYIQPVPVVNLGLDVTQCEGTVTLDAGNPGNVYLWSDQSSNQTLTVSNTGIYSVTVGDINSNCTATDNVSVTINQAPVVDLGSDVEQCGGIVTLDADNPGSTYLWSDNSTGQTLTVSSSGIYRVTVTNNTGCTGTGSIIINIYPYPTLGADKTDSVCVGYTVDLNTYYANSGYASYTWDTQTPSAVGAGVYNLIVTNSAGCADTATVTIINRQQPNLGPDLADSVCIGYTYDLWTLYPPSPAYVTYVWNTPTPSVVTAGTYTLIVTNASGCSDTLNAVITTRQQPNLGPDKADSVCVGYTLDLTTYYPNTGYETYVWNTATPDSVGPGVYTLIVSNTSGCYDTAVMTITYRQQPIVTLNMLLAMCYTEPPFELTGGMPAGGTYVVGDSLNVDTFSAVLFGIGIHHITYIYTNASGCTDSASIDFTVHPQPNITTDTAPDLCTGSSPMNLNNYFTPLGGGYVGFGVSQNYFYPALTGAGNDTITYYYTDQFGCKDTAVYPLSVKNSVHVSLVTSDVDFTICQRDNITFTASGAEFYLFYVNGIAQDTAPSLSNTFSTSSLNNHDAVYVIGSNSCSADTSESIFIDVITLPTVDAGPDTTIALGQIVNLHTKATGTGLLIYNWTPNYWLNFANVPNPTYSGPDTVTFEVRVTDTYGCWGADSITINVYVPDNVLLPNIITPDGDGKNDIWRLNYKINLDGSNLVIFNRWGETVYEANNYTNDWDGTYKATGKKLPDDTYYYVLKVPAQNNHVYKGAINILNGTAK